MQRILFLTGNNFSRSFLDYEARTGSVFPEPYRTYFNQFFVDLIRAGIYNELDLMYVFKNNTRQAAITNLVSSSFTATEVSSPTWAQWTGYNFSTLKYLNTNYNYLSSSVKFQTNSASQGHYCAQEAALGTVRSWGAASILPSNSNTYLTVRNGSSQTQYGMNQNSVTVQANIQSLGLHAVTRDSANIRKYLNGTQESLFAWSGSIKTDNNCFVGTYNFVGSPNTYDTRLMQLMFIGSNNINQATLYSIVNNFFSKF